MFRKHHFTRNYELLFIVALRLYIQGKKELEPIATLKSGVYVKDVIDDAIVEKTDEKIKVNRNMRILEMAEDGSHIRMWISAAMDFHNDTLWYPKSLLAEVVQNVGYPQPCSVGGGQDIQLVSECMRATWEVAGEWTADSIKYLIKEHGFRMVFSHFHNVDLQGHMIVQFLKRGNSSFKYASFCCSTSSAIFLLAIAVSIW